MEDNDNKTGDVIATMEFRVRTREELWAKVYNAAIEHGFTEEKAIKASDDIVAQVFDNLLPEGAEEELRQYTDITEN